MIPFPIVSLARADDNAVVRNDRVPAGDMDSGSDRRILAGDMQSGSDARDTQETL